MGNKRTLTKTKEPPLVEGFDNQQILRQLEEIASRLAVQIRYEKGDFNNAGCRIDAQQLIIMQKADSDSAKINTLMRELGRFDLSQINLHPALLDRMQTIQHESHDHTTAQEER